MQGSSAPGHLLRPAAKRVQVGDNACTELSEPALPHPHVSELPMRTPQGFSDVGVFWDFGSLHQRPFGSEAEAASYAYARDETMDAWFAHQGTAVLMLTQHPMKRGSHRQHGYEESGWPTLERCCAEQLKQTFLTDCRRAAGRHGRRQGRPPRAQRDIRPASSLPRTRRPCPPSPSP